MNPPNQPTLAPTPRTDEAYFANGATMYSLAGEMKLIERELAAEREKVRVLREAFRDIARWPVGAQAEIARAALAATEAAK
jgi:hypothetical protein